MLSATTKNLIKTAALRAKPPRKITGSQWAQNYRFYSSDVSPNPGRHNNDRVPYQKYILDAWTDSEIEEITIVSSSQTGKTTVPENGMGYQVTEDPCSIMMVHPRMEDAEDFSKDRWDAMVRDTPVLRAIFGLKKTKNSGNTILKKKFPGGFIKFSGSNSPASLASRSIRVLILDEKDRYEKSVGREGDPSSLARKRTTTFHNRKIVNISTPTIENHSAIMKDWDRSDQRDFYCECPHCKERITLQFEQLKTLNEADIEGSTVYICQSCDALIEESQRLDLLATMIPIAAKPFAGHAGFRINQLYSPWVPWHKTMKEYLESKDEPEKLKVFTNTALGRTWKITSEQLNWEILYSRRGQYKRTTVPMGGLFLTASADIQKNRIEVEIKAWGRGKKSYSVEHIVLPGLTNEDKVWKDLEEVLDSTYTHESGNQLSIRMMAVDSGYRAEKVYDFVRKFPQSRVIAVKGGPSSMMVMVSPPKTVDVERKSGKRKKSGPRIWMVGGDLIKSEFFGNLAKERSDAEVAAGIYPSGYCHYPNDYEPDFFKQLTTEVLVPRKTGNGQIVHEWRKLNNDDRNEAIDLHVYNRALANILGIDRFKDSHWCRFEEDLGIVSAQTNNENQSTDSSEPAKKRKKKKNKVIVKSSGFLSR